jgi:hypothetical protein
VDQLSGFCLRHNLPQNSAVCRVKNLAAFLWQSASRITKWQNAGKKSEECWEEVATNHVQADKTHVTFSANNLTTF